MRKNINTERVIEEVEARPLLWDISHEMYRDRIERHKAWKEISRIVFEDFDELSYQEQAIATKKVQDRWRTARDTFTKIKHMKADKKGATATYCYYNLLSFLESNYTHKAMESARYREELSTVEDDNSSELLVRKRAAPRTRKSKPSKPENIVLKTEPQTDSSDTENDPFSSVECKEERIDSIDFEIEAPATSKSLATKRKIVEENASPKTMDGDDDFAFFTSIMPTIKKFTSYQKLLFRSKVLQYLLDIEKEKVTSTS